MHNHRAIVYSCSCMLCAALACTCFEQLYHTSTATGRACCVCANVGALHRVDGRNSFAHKHPKKKRTSVVASPPTPCDNTRSGLCFPIFRGGFLLGFLCCWLLFERDRNPGVAV